MAHLTIGHCTKYDYNKADHLNKGEFGPILIDSWNIHIYVYIFKQVLVNKIATRALANLFSKF